MKLVEKLAREYDCDQTCGSNQSCACDKAFQAGMRKMREMIIQHLRSNVGPGSPETLDVTEQFGEEEA